MADHICPWWGGYFIDNRFRRFLHKPEKILSPYIQPGMTVMDFGCGMGFFSIAMAKMVGDKGSVIAVDLQQEMLTVLWGRANRAGVADRVHTHQCERDSVGVQHPVDFVLAFWSAHEVPDIRGLLTEAHRFLVPRGKMLLVEPRGHVTAKTFGEMIAVAQEVGFRIEYTPRIRLSRATMFSRE